MKRVILAVHLFAVCFVAGMDKPKLSVHLDDYDIGQVVGKGAFGTVIQVRHKETGQIRAMKALRKDNIEKRGQEEHTTTERKVAELVDNMPFAVKVLDAFQDDYFLYIISDFQDGGEFFNQLVNKQRDKGKFKYVSKPMSEEDALFYTVELVVVLNALHKKKVVYRDLKPENILLDKEGHVKLTDFGLSKILTGKERTFSTVGTPDYIAPEVWTGGDEKFPGHSYAADWWSLGCLLFYMLKGYPPFDGKTVDDIKRRVCLRNSDRFPLLTQRIPKNISKNAKDLIKGLLVDEENRLGTNGGVDEIKNMAFFETIDWEETERTSRGGVVTVVLKDKKGTLSPPWTPKPGFVDVPEELKHTKWPESYLKNISPVKEGLREPHHGPFQGLLGRTYA